MNFDKVLQVGISETITFFGYEADLSRRSKQN